MPKPGVAYDSDDDDVAGETGLVIGQLISDAQPELDASDAENKTRESEGEAILNAIGAAIESGSHKRRVSTMKKKASASSNRRKSASTKRERSKSSRRETEALRESRRAEESEEEGYSSSSSEEEDDEEYEEEEEAYSSEEEEGEGEYIGAHEGDNISESDKAHIFNELKRYLAQNDAPAPVTTSSPKKVSNKKKTRYGMRYHNHRRGDPFENSMYINGESYHCSVGGEIRDLRIGAQELITVIDVDEIEKNMEDEEADIYIRILSADTMTPLGVRVLEFGKQNCCHHSMNGDFQATFGSKAGKGEIYFLGRYKKHDKSKTTNAAVAALQELKLSRNREFNMDPIWGHTKATASRIEKDYPVEYREDDNIVIIPESHPYLHMIDDRDSIQTIGKKSFGMNIGEFKKLGDDYTTVVEMLERHYTEKPSLTIAFMPLATSQAYDPYDPTMWNDINGVDEYYIRNGAQKSTALDLYYADAVNVQYEIIVV